MPILTRDELTKIVPTFSETQLDFLFENCIIALEINNHNFYCKIKIIDRDDIDIFVEWKKKFKKSGYKEKKKIMEKAAEAISFFLTSHLTEYTVVEEAPITSGFDYWLGYNENDQDYDPINFMKAKLEVSGLEIETPNNTIKKRFIEKKNQIKRGKSAVMQAYISIVEFHTPKALFKPIYEKHPSNP